MDASRTTFRYRLEPVLRRDAWERDVLGGELARAHVLEEQCRLRWQAALAEVSAAEVRMRELHRQDQPIALESRRLLHDFIEHAHVIAATCLANWTRAHDMMEQLRAQFHSKQVAVRTLERHRETRRHEHDTEQSRRGQNLADEQWLMQEKRR